MRPHPDLLAGVIEGFYGPPWSWDERLELFARMHQWGLNTYLYAPKDDLKHRALWREPYSDAEAGALSELIRACKQTQLRFIFALSPGLDIHYRSDADLDLLRKRFEQIAGLGCRDFGLLFDDIPDRMQSEDANRFGSFATAHSHVANTLFLWARERFPDGRFLFCPTPYCGRMAESGLGGKDYLTTIGGELRPEIDVLWTGPEIISREISVGHVRELRSVLRRKPLIWDNLYANDYDGRRFYCGPYAGRPPGLLEEVSGLLVNPNNEASLNYVPLRTFADFIQGEGDWNPRKAYLSAMSEWLPGFLTVGQPITLEDLILFGDCYYLPYEEGPEAEALSQQTQGLVLQPNDRSDDKDGWGNQAARLRAFCARLTELRDRRLFHALHRRAWELREELDLLQGYIHFRARNPDAAYASDFHLPGTFRGGFVARLQRLLEQKADGKWIRRAARSGSEPV